MELNTLLALIMLITAITLLMLGMHLAFVLSGIATIFGIYMYGSLILDQFTIIIYDATTSYTMVAVPLFVLMGSMLNLSGIAERLYSSLHVILGPLKGGLAIATLVLATIFGACTGTAGAAVITIGIFAMSAMQKAKYDMRMASGVVCAGGGLGVIIPPSIVLILYGPVAGISIAKLFMASLIPGLVLSAAYIIYVAVLCYLKPSAGPPLPVADRNLSFKEMLKLFSTSILPFIVLIAAILGVIFFGIASPSEAAAIGAAGAIITAMCYRKLSGENIREAAKQTALITTMVMFVVLGASLFNSVFLRAGGGDFIKGMLLGLPFFKGQLIVFPLLFLVIILGCFMDWIGLLMILVPIYVPILKSTGIDQLWFGVLFGVALQISYMTPPFAYSAFYLKSVTPKEVTLKDIYIGALPFVVIQIICLFLLYLFPAISTWLPSLM